MLWELNVSHTGAGSAAVWPSVEPVIWESSETGVDVRLLNGQVVITRLDAGSPAEEAGLKTGFFIQKIERISMEQILAEMGGHLSPPHTEAGRMDILTCHVLNEIHGEPGTCERLANLDEQDTFHEQCIERIQRVRKGYKLPPAGPASHALCVPQVAVLLPASPWRRGDTLFRPHLTVTPLPSSNNWCNQPS